MQVTTVSLFKYEGFGNKMWAFGMMQFAHKHLKHKDIHFYKLLGSGKGDGFNPYPDWSTYSLLIVWKSRDAAEAFIAESALFGKYRKKTKEMVTCYLQNIAAQGEWSGKNPFQSVLEYDKSRPVAVITRATIKASKLRKFWSYVPTSSKPLTVAEGLIYKKGIGEVPLLQMATFSVWENLQAVKNYAYSSKEHQKAIALTRSLDWYKEELFSRFSILHIEGDLTSF